jgi:hypothetical protein
MADALVSSGLASLGFTYINLDDCWWVFPKTKLECIYQLDSILLQKMIDIPGNLQGTVSLWQTQSRSPLESPH